MTLRYGRVVHLRQPPTPCCHDAVAFGHRRVNFRLTGTSTPPCGRLRRRTSAECPTPQRARRYMPPEHSPSLWLASPLRLETSRAPLANRDPPSGGIVLPLIAWTD